MVGSGAKDEEALPAPGRGASGGAAAPSAAADVVGNGARDLAEVVEDGRDVSEETSIDTTVVDPAAAGGGTAATDVADETDFVEDTAAGAEEDTAAAVVGLGFSFVLVRPSGGMEMRLRPMPPFGPVPAASPAAAPAVVDAFPAAVPVDFVPSAAPLAWHAPVTETV